MRRTGILLAALLLTLPAVPAPAVTITIVNKDGAGTGLNDPTPATPVGGNPGTTIGQQRMNVFNKAAEIWGGILPGNVEIRVDASFSSNPPMTCTATTAVLGGTAPIWLEANFTNAPVSGTWYVVAEANQLAGVDLEPGESHLSALFNARLGQPGCFDGSYFYYGFDTNTPPDDVNFLTVVLHEFAHGVGFYPTVNPATGAFYFGGLPGIFDLFVYDTTAGKTFSQMTSNAERKASAINTGNLVWNGPAANAAGAAYLATGVPALLVSSPAAAAGSYVVGTASFGPALTEAGVTGTLVAALDPSDANGPLTTDACSALTNASQVAGKIALVDRGTCYYVTKALNVQAAGAIGLVIANNVSGGPPVMGGTSSSVVIPLVSISQSDGAKLRANLPATVTIGLDMTRRAGMNANGQLLLYAPNPVEPGSSVSHWDTSASPDLLMEPYINPDLPIGVDITPDLFRDIGWFGPTQCPAISLSPASLPNGTAGVAYGPVTLTPTSGIPPFTFNVSGLPAGLSRTSPATGPDVSIGGTPTSAFSGSVTVSGADANAPACPFSQAFPLTVSNAPPAANFTFFSANPKAGQRVQFTDTSTGSPTSWSWDFGDGGTSSVQNPVHTFSKGTYQVSLTASNAGGSNTRTQTVVVSWDSPVVCAPDTHTMCMVNGRYKVTSHWKNQYAGGAEATLSKALLTDTTGAFWIFDPATYEYLIRFNTATDNGRAWISIPGSTDVEFWIAVFDTITGQYKEYHSPIGNRTLIYDPYFFVYP